MKRTRLLAILITSATVYGTFSFIPAAFAVAPSSGLVGYWSFSEGSGTSAADSSGSGNTATLTNDPSWGSGQVGSALSFDGTDDRLQITQSTSRSTIYNNGGGGMSVAFWLNPTALTTASLFSLGAGSDREWDSSLNTAGRISAFVNFDTATDLNVRFNAAATTGSWQHFVVTWNGGTATTDIVLYKNGANFPLSFGDAGAGNPVDNASEAFMVGDLFSGAMDEVRVYQRALSPAEVLDVYNDMGSTSSPPPAPPPPPPADTTPPPPSPTPPPPGGCSAANVRCVPSEYPTIQACASAAQPGETCLVSSGIYSQTINVSSSGTSGSPITFVASGTATVCGFDFTNRSYVRVVGFTMDNDAGCVQDHSPVLLDGTNNNLEFWENTFTDATNGIRLTNTARINNSLVIGNVFSNMGIGNGGGAAAVINGNNNLVTHNEIYNMHPDGFIMFGSGNRWTNNYFYAASEASGGHSDFFQSGSRDTGWNNSLIEGNFQAAMGNTGNEHVANVSNGQASVYCPSGCGAMTENIIRRNVWHNVSSGTFGINQSFDGPITHTRYYNNTTVEASRVSPTARYSMTWTHTGTNYGYIFNNIEYEGWGTGVNSGILVYCLSRDTICNPAAAGGFTYGMGYNIGYDPQGSVTFASPWTTQTSPLSNVNPQFVNYAADDFHLQSGSPAVGAAGALTTVTSVSGTGTTFAVVDAGFFRGDNAALNQYGGNLVVGDTITVGTDVVQIASISGNTITATNSFTWASGDPVFFGSGSSPEIGAYPYYASGYDFNVSVSSDASGVTANVTNPQAVRYVVFFVNGVPSVVDNQFPYTLPWSSLGLPA